MSKRNRDYIITELPRHKSGRNKGKVNCQAMKDMELKILYREEIYTVKIEEYIRIKGKDPKFKINYNGNISEVYCNSFINKCEFGGVLKKYGKNFKIEIGEVFKDCKRDIVVIDREYRKDKKGQNWKWYKYRCNKCKHLNGEHYECWINEYNLLSGQGCNCCSNNVIIEDINSIWVTDREFCEKYKISERDAKTHTMNSTKNIVITCPDCGKQKEINLNSLSYQGLGCICGSGFSYPERFMMSVLEQLEVLRVFQLSKKHFEWCGSFRYDFYIEEDEIIIETHGGQHYEDCGWSKAKDVQENDRIKYELALQNGIKDEDYIVIDCRYSDKEWIKNSILNSKLNKLYDLSKIDWLKAHEFALLNIIKEVCNYWNNKEGWETAKDLENIFKVNRCTILRYLKKGTELGWCNYIGKKR